MSLAATMRALYAAGATTEVLIALVETEEARREAELSERRAKDAARKRKPPVDSTEFHGIPRNDADSAKPSPHVGERTQVVTPSLPSLRSEELKTPKEPNGSLAPKVAETSRGTRLADHWRPDDLGFAYAVQQLGPNVDPERELDRFRDYWRSIPGAKGRKLDWPGTWRNWVRNAADKLPRKASHGQPAADAKLTARHANYARAWEGSERAAGRDWKP